MDCVIILFGRKLDPVKPDPEKQFLMASWGEALKVLNSYRSNLFYLFHLYQLYFKTMFILQKQLLLVKCQKSSSNFPYLR